MPRETDWDIDCLGSLDKPVPVFVYPQHEPPTLEADWEKTDKVTRLIDEKNAAKKRQTIFGRTFRGSLSVNMHCKLDTPEGWAHPVTLTPADLETAMQQIAAGLKSVGLVLRDRKPEVLCLSYSPTVQAWKITVEVA